MFSLTRTGTFPFGAEIDLAALPTHLAECLRSVHASTVEIRGNCVAFTGGMFRLVSNWNVLVPFGSGDLTVDGNSRKIAYRVNVRQLVVGATGMVLVMATFFIFTSSLWQPLLFLPLMWLWLVGGNLIIGVARFEAFVRRAMATAPHLADTHLA